MTRAKLAILSILAVFTGFLPGDRALGGVPASISDTPLQPPVQPKKLSPARPLKTQRITRRISSYESRIRQEVLAKLRPVEQHDGGIDFDSAQKTLTSTKTIQEKIFGSDFEKKMRTQYSAKVTPFEQTANDPVWRARSWEVARYEDGRKDLAKWTTREVIDDQLKEFFNGGDSSSAPMQVLAAARTLSGGDDSAPAAGPVLTPEQKIARAHRTDLPPVKQEEEQIPLKLRTKINVIKAQGSIVFSNPVATTSVNGDRDDVSIGMNREFRKLALRSNLSYAVVQECLNLNVNKKITERVSLDLDHATYTGDKRGSTGEKNREQARVNYSLSF